MSDTVFYLLPMNKLYKKEKQERSKNFPAGYVGRFYRNLADNFLGSEFYSRITNDADIPSEDVQKYILAASDFAKSIQTDINHYVTSDRINDASFRQKLDPISQYHQTKSFGACFWGCFYICYWETNRRVLT